VGVGREPLPAESIPVAFIRTGGVELDQDTLRATTDADGKFVLTMPAGSGGEVVGDLVFTPPTPIPAMRVPDVHMRTTRAAGDLYELGKWKIDYPYIGYQIFLHYRATGKPAAGLEAVFRKTSGISTTPDTLRMVSDARGYLILRPEVSAVGTVTGDLTVNLLPPRAPLVLRDLRLSTFQEERYDSVISVGIGLRLPYSAIIVSAATGSAVAGAEVEFERTGGIQIYPEHFVARSDEYGTVHLDPVPLEAGELRGNFIVRPPAPGEPLVIRDVRLPTVEDDRIYELLGYWGVSGL
jgi:hypothetical protein